MRVIGRVVLGILALLVAGVAGFAALAWEPAIAPALRPDPASFDPQLVTKGEQLAAVGNCIACHTTPGGRAFAGGLAIPTPFGTIYSTNITPDVETGIGAWTEAAFVRAMREGVDREGHHLYPAFPYDHFTLVSDDDNRALYAYLQTRQPVRVEEKANQLPFPLNQRILLAGWKLLFFREGAHRDDPLQSAEFNRGLYLAEGLGHCGGCHTPRNGFGAERREASLSGGEAEGWQSYALDGSSPAPVPWTKDALAFYLRHGFHPEHGVARGPMAEVTGNLDALPDTDIAALATYVEARMGKPTAERLAAAESLRQFVAARPGQEAPAVDSMITASAATPQKPARPASDRGAMVYAAACAICHDSGRPQPFGGLSFHLSTAVNAPNPQNIVNVTLFGLPPGDGGVSSVMPAFASTLNDADLIALLGYLRATFTDKPAWTGLETQIRDTRSGARPVTIRPADGIERSPRNIGAGRPLDQVGSPLSGGPAGGTKP